MSTTTDPFKSNLQQEEEERRKQNQTSREKTTSETGESTGASLPSAAPTVGAPTSSGRFTNITKYLQANQASRGLAGQIGQKLQQQQSGLRKDIEQKSGAFMEAAKRGATPEPQLSKLTPTETQRIERVDPTTGKITREILHGNSMGAEGLSESEQEQFAGAFNARYSGPTELTGTEGIISGLENLGQTAGGLGTERGRFNVLRSMFGRPSYSTGQQRLDQLLLQGRPEELKQLQGLTTLAKTPERELEQAVGGARQLAQQRASQEADIATRTRKAVEEALSGVSGELEAQKKAAEQSEELRQQQLKDIAYQASQRTGDVTLYPQYLRMLGIAPGTETYGVDLSEYVTQSGPTGIPNITNVGDPSLFARGYALQKISGITPTYKVPTEEESYKAGTVGFDIDKFKNAVTGEQNKMLAAAAAMASLQPNVVTAKKKMDQFGAINTKGMHPYYRDQAIANYNAAKAQYENELNQTKNLLFEGYKQSASKKIGTRK